MNKPLEDADEDDVVDTDRCRVLHDPERLAALTQSGLGSEADPEMEFFADWVQRALGVPVALVSLVQADQQVFPGMVGLPEPWASSRSTPLTHSFCQHVVRTAQPLVISDARVHPLLRHSAAIADLGVIAYAGMPLTDARGNVLGSLCAIDHSSRGWTEDHLDTLRRIARVCSTELRMRLTRLDTGREIDRRDESEEAHRHAFDRSQALLHALRALSEASTVEEVRVRITDVVGSELRPVHIGVVLRDDHGRLHRLGVDPDGAVTGPEGAGAQAATLTAQLLATTAIRAQRVMYYLNREDLDRDYPQVVRQAIRDDGLHSLVTTPLPGGDGPVGALVLGWPEPDAVLPSDLLVIDTIAGYAGAAFDRARVLHHRISVAHELQDAMLTTLPVVTGLSMAARYEPADTRENVGGDWFDAAPVLDADGPAPDDQILALSVGDIMGHTVRAATIMGQARSMLRQSAWDHAGGPPSAILGAFEAANRGLHIGAAGSTVLAHLRRSPGGRWSMEWTNAGHPPPILLLPDGTAELLTDHDPIFGFPFTAGLSRADHRRDLEPGTMLFLYTDGLVEHHSGGDIDDGIDTLVILLGRLRHHTTQEIVDIIVDTLAPDVPDDVVAFAIRIPETV